MIQRSQPLLPAQTTRLTFSSTEKSIMDSNGKFLFGLYSEMCRPDVEWERLVDFLITHFKGQQRVPLYLYANSDNSEGLTLAMRFRYRWGRKRSKPFLPMYASDLYAGSVERAQSGLIHLSADDLRKMKTLTNRQFVAHHFKKRPDLTSGEPADAYRQYTIYETSYPLQQAFQHSQANILEDAKMGKIQGKSIVFFRNVWYHLQAEQKQQLVHNLAKHLEPGSLLICGEQEDLQDPEKAVYQVIRNAGFRPVEDFRNKKGVYVYERSP